MESFPLHHHYVVARDSSQHYIVPTIGSQLPGMRVLAGWNDAFKKIHVPKFETEWLSFDESTYMEKVLGQLIVITLPELQVGGMLRSLLRICVTAVVMHFNEYKRKYGEESSLVRKITSTATRAQLPQGCITQLSAKLSNKSHFI